jgi:carboxypeptidase Taq
MTSAYDELCSRQTRLYRLNHLNAICDWDRAVNMPPGGNEARASATAEIAKILHEMLTEPVLDNLINRAQHEVLGSCQEANLREMKRLQRREKALPEHLISKKKIFSARCEYEWRSQRKANDLDGFMQNFKGVVEVVREEADRLSQALSLSPYEALVDAFEPGLKEEDIDAIFTPIGEWLPGLIESVIKKQRNEPVIQPQGPFQLEAQKRLCEEIMSGLGFDFSRGRLDTSTHPFCGGVPEDVRLTTRFHVDDFLGSLFAAIHETGHGLYQQNLPARWLGQPIGQARSMAFHESQSLFFEMQLGAHPKFMEQLSRYLVRAFGDQEAFTPENLERLVTRVERSFIRVNADEVTYPAHILVRTRLERALFAKDIEPVDLPGAWDHELYGLLGLRCNGDHEKGLLQDIHWAAGHFGYFPSYTLGAMYAAQWFATIADLEKDLEDNISAGNFTPITEWLKCNIWDQGSRWTAEELVSRATGEPLNPNYFRRHLETRYLGQ